MIKIGMLIADRYEVLEKVGTGGMSDVYKAKDHRLNRMVAVKVLKQEFSENATFVSKFRVEAQAAAGLMHPNIVNVYDVGEEKGTYYIIMELVNGITLKRYIEKKGKLTPREAVTVAIQVSLGLAAAHRGHIIHRDIKPQNIIISKEGKVKVTDFGIAKASTSNTITSNVMGSVHYTSPEQARGGYSDEKSDVYSLGVTLFEMLTGRVPYDGETTVAIALQHIQDPFPSPREFVPDLPYSVEQIVLKCCEKSPDRRYQTMDELTTDLRHSLNDPEGTFVKRAGAENLSETRSITAKDREEIRRRTSAAAASAAASVQTGAAAASAGELLSSQGTMPYAVGGRDLQPDGQDAGPGLVSGRPGAGAEGPAGAMEAGAAGIGNAAMAAGAASMSSAAAGTAGASGRAETAGGGNGNAAEAAGQTGSGRAADGLSAETASQDPSALSNRGGSLSGQGAGGVPSGSAYPDSAGQGSVLYEAEEDEEDAELEEDERRLDRLIQILSVIAVVVVGVVIILVALNRRAASSGGSTQEDQDQQQVQPVTEQTEPEEAPAAASTQKEEVIPVPRLVGRTAEDAEAALEQAGFTWEETYDTSQEYDEGIVMAARADEGERLKKGTKVTLTIVKIEKITVPDLIEKKQSDAEKALRELGLVPVIEEAYSEDIEAGYVSGQDPDGGIQTVAGSEIVLYVSKGPDLTGLVQVPNILGMTEQEASAALLKEGLTPGETTVTDTSGRYAPGTVIGQSIEKGEYVEEGTQVDMELSGEPSYSYSARIEAPRHSEDPDFVEGTAVTLSIVTEDGTSLLNTTTSKFPYQVAITGIPYSGATLYMTYTNTILEDSQTGETGAGAEERSIPMEIERELTFTQD